MRPGCSGAQTVFTSGATQLEEVACGEHEDNGKDIDHKIEVDDAFLVLTNVYEYLAWIFVKAVYSIPMA